MRICMISGYAGAGGGLENVVHELSNFLAKQGIQVTVFNSGSRDITKFSQNCTVEELVPYNLLPPKLRFANYDRYTYSLKVWIRIKRSNPFDVIHGHGDHCFFPALFRDRTPLITNIHGVRKAARYREFGPNSLFLKDPRILPLFWPEDLAAKRSNITVACSKSERDELISFHGLKPAKIKVIYNGVDLSKFRPLNKQDARRSLGLPENKTYAIWVGNTPTVKGLEIAIKAVKDLRNLYLLVVGISGNNFDNVIFWGMISNPQKLCELYNAADFLIFPTRYESFGLVALEAMACGVPIIISKECPVREIITDGVEGFVVDQRNSESYTEKIMMTLSDLSQDQATSIRCRKLAEKYSWEKAGQEYLKLYKHVTSS